MKNQTYDMRALREALHWSQDDMARYLGLDRSSVSRMENGQGIKGPTKRLLDVLLKRVSSKRVDAA